MIWNLLRGINPLSSFLKSWFKGSCPYRNPVAQNKCRVDPDCNESCSLFGEDFGQYYRKFSLSQRILVRMGKWFPSLPTPWIITSMLIRENRATNSIFFSYLTATPFSKLWENEMLLSRPGMYKFSAFRMRSPHLSQYRSSSLLPSTPVTCGDGELMICGLLASYRAKML